jgi:hypothetical protein
VVNIKAKLAWLCRACNNRILMDALGELPAAFMLLYQYKKLLKQILAL